MGHIKHLRTDVILTGITQLLHTFLLSLQQFQNCVPLPVDCMNAQMSKINWMCNYASNCKCPIFVVFINNTKLYSYMAYIRILS